MDVSYHRTVAESCGIVRGSSGPDGLVPAAMSKLPIGAIRPDGWLGHQLELMARGMVGRLREISRFLKDDNGWFDLGEYGWEEQPYWLRGFYRLAVLIRSEALLGEAARWMESVLSSQDDDGWFGPRGLKSVRLSDGRELTDLWAHMVMLDVVIVHYEHTGDARVLPFMRRFFEFCRDIPEDRFVPAPAFSEGRVRAVSAEKRYIDVINEQLGKGSSRWFVQWPRSGDMIPHIHWLYERTGEDWLLPLAARFYRHIMPPIGEWLHDHVVNFTQRFSYPATFYRQAGDPWYLEQTEYWYGQHMGTWGQQPRGAFAADERIRPGYVDPRQAIETCAITEFARSFHRLSAIEGDPVYADRCEDVMLNHFPAAQTADLKGVRYLTASNMPISDASVGHDYFNEKRYAGKLELSQVVYSAAGHRCCQHNHGQGWPSYAEHLWYRSADGGLAAWMYGACEVNTTAGRDGTPVTITERTGYPFDETVTLIVKPEEEAEFPLYFRVPGWCNGFRVMVNGEETAGWRPDVRIVRIERVWRSGDSVEILLPMEVSVTRWPRNGSVTVDRGPLSYSVKIEEEWKRCGGDDEWPEWEVLPAGPWNYALSMDPDDPVRSMSVLTNERIPDQPWTVEGAPVEIRVKAKRIPRWIIEDGTVQELRTGPVISDDPEEEITMIPMGCARLRMSCLPLTGGGPYAGAWD